MRNGFVYLPDNLNPDMLRRVFIPVFSYPLLGRLLGKMTVSSSLQEYTQYVDNQIVMTNFLSPILQQQKGRALFFTALPLKKIKNGKNLNILTRKGGETYIQKRD